MRRFKEYLLSCIALAAVTVVVGFAFIISGVENSSIQCTDVDIVITDSLKSRFVSREDVQGYLVAGYGRCIGEKIKDIDFTKIEELVDSKSAVLKAEAYATGDGVLHMEVVQRRPLIRFQGQSGGFYADEDGFLFPLKDNYTSYVTIVDGDFPLHVSSGFKGRCTDEKEKKWLDDMVSMVKFMRESAEWRDNIVQINVRDNGDIVLVPRDGKEKFIFGSPDHIKEKFKLMSSYYECVVPARGENIYSTVNVKFKNQLICRK